MQRDILRDIIFLSFLGIFFWQMYLSVCSLLGKEKGLQVRRVSSNETEFPSVTACPKYCYELDACDTEVGVVDLGSIFIGAHVWQKDGSSTFYHANSTNLSTIITRRAIPAIPNFTGNRSLHSCVEMSPGNVIHPFTFNVVTLILDNSDISAWYITVHNKNHMVGYVSSLYGSAWSYAPTQRQGSSNQSQEIAFQIFHEDITMLNEEDHRCEDSGSEVNPQMCIETYLEHAIGCQNVYTLNNGSTRYPMCNSTQMDKHTTLLIEITEMGEQEIALRTGCLSSCNKKEYTLEKMSEHESLTPLFGPGKTVLHFYTFGGMYYERTQYFIYEMTNFIADFGGYLGLLLGCSLLSFYDKGREWIIILYRRIKAKNKRRRSSSVLLEKSCSSSTIIDGQV